MSMAGTRGSSLAKEGEGELDSESSQCGQEDLLVRWMDAKKDSSMLIGRISVNAKLTRKRNRKAQAFPLPRMARSKAGDPRILQEVGAKGEDVEERMEMAKRHCRASS